MLDRILTEEHGRRYAVIVNEFGEEGIDDALVVGVDENVFEMNNGCICCTVRGDLVCILGDSIERRDRFDAILIETTDLANPAPSRKPSISIGTWPSEPDSMPSSRWPTPGTWNVS